MFLSAVADAKNAAKPVKGGDDVQVAVADNVHDHVDVHDYVYDEDGA